MLTIKYYVCKKTKTKTKKNNFKIWKIKPNETIFTKNLNICDKSWTLYISNNAFVYSQVKQIKKLLQNVIKQNTKNINKYYI